MTPESEAKILDMLQDLATQIGVTVDTIFPWYVNQMRLEGIVGLVALIVTAFVLVYMIYEGTKQAKFGYDISRHDVMLIISVIFGCLWLTTFSIEISTFVTKIMNPEFHAMQKLLLNLRGVR